MTTENNASTRREQRRLLGRVGGSVGLVAAVGLIVTLTALGANGSTRSMSRVEGNAATLLPNGQNITGKTVLFLPQNAASNSFFIPAVNGAKAAAAITGLKLDIEYGNNSDTTEATAIQTAVAKGEAGYIVGVPDAGLNKALCAAHATGGPVIAFNINGSTGNTATTCVQAFIGQSFVSAGSLIASYMVSQGLIKKGDHVFCPVEFASYAYAVERAQGVNSVLSTLGIKCDILGTNSTDLAPTKATLVQYLLGHRNTSAIIALGGTPLAEAPAAIRAAGLKIPIGGFDLSFPEIVTGVQNGTIAASVNQEPYAQGFYSVMEIAMDLKYGIPPESINTSDNALLTKKNIGSFSSLVPYAQ